MKSCTKILRSRGSKRPAQRRSSQRGVILMEMALVLSSLTSIFSGMIQYGLALREYAIVVEATRIASGVVTGVVTEELAGTDREYPGDELQSLSEVAFKKFTEGFHGIIGDYVVTTRVAAININSEGRISLQEEEFPTSSDLNNRFCGVEVLVERRDQSKGFFPSVFGGKASIVSILGRKPGLDGSCS